jgi:ribosome-associated protein
LEIRVPVRELRFEWSRSGGPGGQRVNKANTRVTLRWSVDASRAIPAAVRDRFRARYRRRINSEGELVLHSQRFRDQGRNVADCVEKLEEMLRSVAEPPTPRRPTRPTRASKERRLRQKQRDATRKRERKRPRRDE